MVHLFGSTILSFSTNGTLRSMRVFVVIGPTRIGHRCRFHHPITGGRRQCSDWMNQPEFLSLAAGLFPSLFLRPCICLNRVIDVGAEDQS